MAHATLIRLPTSQLRSAGGVCAVEGLMGRGWSRRRVVAMLGGVVAGQGGALPAVAKKRSDNQINDEQISDRQAIEILIEESEAEKHPVDRTLIKPFWFTQAVGERPSPTWP